MKHKVIQNLFLGCAAICFLIAFSLFRFPQYFLGVKKEIVSFSKTTSILPSPTPSPITIKEQVVKHTYVITPTATSTPIPTVAAISSTTAPTQQPTVNLQIIEPNGTVQFSVPVEGNACDELTEAKNEGKITSVTITDQYMSTNHSLYVTELNGYKNNWTFSVNGQSPQGCSLISPKAGDSVVWRFG